jgi:hypothetical protein
MDNYENFMLSWFTLYPHHLDLARHLRPMVCKQVIETKDEIGSPVQLQIEQLAEIRSRFSNEILGLKGPSNSMDNFCQLVFDVVNHIDTLPFG